MQIELHIQADNFAGLRIEGTETYVQLKEDFAGAKWDAAGLLRLSASLKGAALTMMARAGE